MDKWIQPTVIKSLLTVRLARFLYASIGTILKSRKSLLDWVLDINHFHNTRVRIKTKAITAKGFAISFEPWGSGIAHQMGVHWMACPWRRTSIQALYNCSSNLNCICMLSLKYFFHLKCLWYSFVFNINKKALFPLIRP